MNATNNHLQAGLVVAHRGRHCEVQTPAGGRVLCHPRGKKNQALVGDRVLWLPTGDSSGLEGTLERIEPRRNWFYRQDELRTKAFAANVAQVVVWLAAEPEFSTVQLNRALVAAQAQTIPVLLVLNKADLQTAHATAAQRLAYYAELAPMLHVSVQTGQGFEALQSALRGKVNLILGPSGTGKSSLINRLVPSAQLATQEISTALNSGKHTTTHTTLHWLDAACTTALIDSPGFQEFGLHHLKDTPLASLMPDFMAHAENCKFYNCTHQHEPACGVKAWIDSRQDAGLQQRYWCYGELLREQAEAKLRY